MANHCIEVVCAGCGRIWCERGCNYSWDPDPETAQKVRERIAAARAAGKEPYLYGSIEGRSWCCGEVVSDSYAMG